MCVSTIKCVILLTIVYLSSAKVTEFPGKVSLKCITDRESYCEGKKDDFKFNDGCNMCHCRNHTIICPKIDCKYTVRVNQQKQYCQQIRKQNDKFYRVFTNSTYYVNNTAERIKTTRNIGMKRKLWSINFGNYYFRNFYRSRLFLKRNYKSKLKILLRRKVFQKKMIKRLKKKKKQLMKTYKRWKRIYQTYKEDYPFLRITRRYKYKLRRQMLVLKMIKKQLKYYIKRFKKIKKAIRKLKRKIKLSKSKKSKSKISKNDFLKRLRKQYKKNKKRYLKLKRKRLHLLRRDEKHKNLRNVKKRLMTASKLAEIIKRIKSYMRKLKERYFRTEGNRNKKKRYFIKRKPKRRDKRKKLVNKRRKKKNQTKVKKPDINKDRDFDRQKNSKQKEKQNVRKDDFSNNKPKQRKKIFKKNKERENLDKHRRDARIPRKKKQGMQLPPRKLKLFPKHPKIKSKHEKRHVPNEIKNRRFKPPIAKGHLKIAIQPFPRKGKRTRNEVQPRHVEKIHKLTYAEMLSKLREKHVQLPTKKRSLRDLLDENKRITKNIKKIKTYFHNHLRLNNSEAERHFTEKLKKLIPYLNEMSFTSETSNRDLVKRYIDDKENHLTPIQMKYLRSINDDIYKRYLKLSRMSLLERRLHRQLQLKNGKSIHPINIDKRLKAKRNANIDDLKRKINKLVGFANGINSVCASWIIVLITTSIIALFYM